MAWEGAKVSRVGDMVSETVEMGELIAARHRIPAGFDSAPYYRDRGLPDGMCPCEHWCFLVSGRLRYRFNDDTSVEVGPGEAFHLKAGHLADVLEDSELVEFTRAEEYRRKSEHLRTRR